MISYASLRGLLRFITHFGCESARPLPLPLTSLPSAERLVPGRGEAIEGVEVLGWELTSGIPESATTDE
jgi:hypothetical protein